MPTIPSIRTSIENQSLLIKDSHAKDGQFIRDTKGRLCSYSGGFTVVYPYILNGKKWAFRCWHSNLGNVRERFNIISQTIQDANLQFLCDFIYVDEGVVVDGIVYPTTRMSWVDGINIKDYICEHRFSKSKLLQLSQKFLTLVKDMHKRNFAHGDLQHGNIIVSDNEEIFLVDYDSFYCPELKGERDIITGLTSYQHPARKQNKFTSEKIDYFSEIIIYLSIRAIAENPSLVDKYQVKDSEQMLFSSKDFIDLRKSLIYKDISLLGEEFITYLDILELYLSKKSIDELEPFDVLLKDINRLIDYRCSIKNFSVKKQTDDRFLVLWDTLNANKVTLNDKDVTGQKKSILTINGSLNVVLRAENTTSSDTKECFIVNELQTIVTEKIIEKEVCKSHYKIPFYLLLIVVLILLILFLFFCKGGESQGNNGNITTEIVEGGNISGHVYNQEEGTKVDDRPKNPVVKGQKKEEPMPTISQPTRNEKPKKGQGTKNINKNKIKKELNNVFADRDEKINITEIVLNKKKNLVNFKIKCDAISSFGVNPDDLENLKDFFRTKDFEFKKTLPQDVKYEINVSDMDGEELFKL